MKCKIMLSVVVITAVIVITPLIANSAHISPCHGCPPLPHITEMLVSDRNPIFTISALDGVKHGAVLKLDAGCRSEDSDCSWIHTEGMLVNRSNPKLAINAWGGAKHGTILRLHEGCKPDNPDCTWTYINGMFISDRNPKLAINAWGGAKYGITLRLHEGCRPDNPDCTWTYMLRHSSPDLGYYERQQIREVKLHFINTCNKNGVMCLKATKNTIKDLIKQTDSLHYRSGSEVRFVISEQTDFNATVNLNVRGGVTGKDVLDLQNKYKAAPVYVARGGNFSSCGGHRIVLGSGGITNPLTFSHETGHYLCTPHPFRGNFDISRQKAEENIKAYVEDNDIDPSEKDNILNALFDADMGKINNFTSEITDTPPDLRSVFAEVNNGDRCGIDNNTVDLIVNFPGNVVYSYTIASDRRNIMNYGFCYLGYMHSTPDQVQRMHEATMDHRAPVTTFRKIPTWRKRKNIAIPAARELRFGQEPEYAVSSILVHNADGNIWINQGDKIIVGVDIKHPRGGLHIDLIGPDGKLYVLQKPSDNKKRVPYLTNGEVELLGNIKTLFFIDGITTNKVGLWKLRVREEAHDPADGEGYIDDWQIQIDSFAPFFRPIFNKKSKGFFVPWNPEEAIHFKLFQQNRGRALQPSIDKEN